MEIGSQCFGFELGSHEIGIFSVVEFSPFFFGGSEGRPESADFRIDLG